MSDYRKLWKLFQEHLERRIAGEQANIEEDRLKQDSSALCIHESRQELLEELLSFIKATEQRELKSPHEQPQTGDTLFHYPEDYTRVE